MCIRDSPRTASSHGAGGQGDRTILIIPLSWSRPGSTAASAAELEPGTGAHASVLQRLAACPTTPAWTLCQALERAPGLSPSRAESWSRPQRRRCATGSVVFLGPNLAKGDFLGFDHGVGHSLLLLYDAKHFAVKKSRSSRA